MHDARQADAAFEDPFPTGDGHRRWQAEMEARAAARERELAEILARVAARTHTAQDVLRLGRELDVAPSPPR